MQSIALKDSKDLIFSMMRMGPASRQWVVDWFMENCQERVAKPGLPKKPFKRCVNNSIEKLSDFRLEGKKASYVEGIAVSIIPTPHAWNQIDGEWFDFTYGKRAIDTIYYGVVIPTPLLLAAAVDDAWTMSCGVMQTIMLSRDKGLQKLAGEFLYCST